MRKTMTHEELELNGCYAMLCEALRAWYRLQHDHTRELAAKTLKDVYGYEFHLNGGGCPWRLPSVDHEWALNGMRALGLPEDKFTPQHDRGHENRRTLVDALHRRPGEHIRLQLAV